jgi:DNA-binding FadR family transcriptional regulator
MGDADAAETAMRAIVSESATAVEQMKDEEDTRE